MQIRSTLHPRRRAISAWPSSWRKRRTIQEIRKKGTLHFAGVKSLANSITRKTPKKKEMITRMPHSFFVCGGRSGAGSLSGDGMRGILREDCTVDNSERKMKSAASG
jgi:hypothetical protein